MLREQRGSGSTFLLVRLNLKQNVLIYDENYVIRFIMHLFKKSKVNLFHFDRTTNPKVLAGYAPER